MAPVLTFRTEAELITRANATTFGLASYVYTQDYARILRLAEALEYGLVGVNDATGYTHEIPLAATRKAAWGGKGGTRAWRSISKASRLCSICRHPKSGGKRFLQSLRAAPPWEQQGQSQEAYDILAPVSHWVIEGCDTDDLQNAKTLLEALACVVA